MDIQTLSFSQESFLMIKKEMIVLREENAWLKGKLAQIESKYRGNEIEGFLESKYGLGSEHVNDMSLSGLKELLARRERQIIQAGNDNFLKDNLIEQQYEQIEQLKKQNANIKQLLEKFSSQHTNTLNQATSKIGQFLSSPQIQSLPFEYTQQQTGKRKLLRKHRLQFDIDSFTSTETSDEFINN